MLNNIFAYLTVAFMDLKEREEGQGMVEYALILVLVSILAIAALTLMGQRIDNIFDRIGTALT